MIPVYDSDEYMRRMLEQPRPGDGDVLAFYEHRVGGICTDPRLMLLPLDDHIVHRGDGVFETLKYEQRRIYQVEPHIERMKRSSSAIHLQPPCSWDELVEIMVATAKAGGEGDGLVRILLGRGPGGFGIDPRESPMSSLYVAAYRLHRKPDEMFEKGATAFKTSIPAKQEYMATIKSINYLPNVLMKREALEKGYDYPVCFDPQGSVAEGATENVAIVDREGTLVIPEFTNSLAGTTLMRTLDLIAGEVPIRFTGIAEGEIYEAKEMMIFGTTGDCVPVVRFNGKPIHDVRPGPLAKRFRELIRRDIMENGLEF